MAGVTKDVNAIIGTTFFVVESSLFNSSDSAINLKSNGATTIAKHLVRSVAMMVDSPMTCKITNAVSVFLSVLQMDETINNISIQQACWYEKSNVGRLHKAL